MAARRIDVREVPGDESPARWRKAAERLKAMERSLEAGDLDAALLDGVHAVIAAADALTIRHLGVVCASERHEDAAFVVEQVRVAPGLGEAARHLKRLLKSKGAIEYSSRYPRPEEARSLCEHARRFVEFVEKNLG